MKKYIFFLLILLLSIYGCSGSKRSDSVSSIMLNGSEVTVSFLNKLKSDTATIPLSSLIEGCELIQLEYTEDAIFKPDNTTITNNYIGVIQEMGAYKLFNRSGKFLGSIGSFGQGPGEYFILNYDIIDENNELIYLAPLIGNKIYVFNTSGRFLKNFELPQTILHPVLLLSNDILTVVYTSSIAEDKTMITQININTGQIFNEFSTQIKQTSQRVGFHSCLNIPDVFDIVHAAYDTIYHFDISNYALRQVFATSDDFSEDITKRHRQLNKDLVLTSVRPRGFVLTDIKNKRSSWVKMKNDFFGSLNVQNPLSTFYNGYYVYNIQPEQLIEEIKQRLTESGCTEKDRQILQKTLSNLKEDTNNVVFIGKLKNFAPASGRWKKNASRGGSPDGNTTDVVRLSLVG